MWVVILEVILISTTWGQTFSQRNESWEINLHSTKACQNHGKTLNKEDQETTEATKQKLKYICLQSRRWGRAFVAPGGLTCVVCPAIGEPEGVGVAPCLLVFLEPAKENWGGKVSKYPPGSPGPLPHERCHAFLMASWISWWLQEAAGPCLWAEHIWNSCRSPEPGGNQEEL